jgi:hypothetical protein
MASFFGYFLLVFGFVLVFFSTTLLSIDVDLGFRFRSEGETRTYRWKSSQLPPVVPAVGLLVGLACFSAGSTIINKM